MSTILLIDLSSVLHPLWHTTQGSTNPNECSIQTVGRVRALASGRTSGVVICCDSGRSFRRDIDPTYKANRPERDATLAHQMTLAIETLKGDGFPVWAAPGMEADDLLASAVQHYTDALPVSLNRGDVTFIIATSDKDLFQIVSDRVTVHRVSDTKKAVQVTPDVVQAEYGIAPNQMRDFLCLVGDKSDNITGAKGIGEVKAAAMLARYGNLDDLYAAIDKGEKFQPSTAASLAEFRPRLETVRALVTLRTDVPLPFEEVFRERVPTDVAVFGGFDGDEDMAGPGEVSDRTTVVGTDAPGTVGRGTITAHGAAGGGNGPSHAGTGADSTSRGADRTQEQTARAADGWCQSQAAAAAGVSAQVTAPVDPMAKLAQEAARPTADKPTATADPFADLMQRAARVDYDKALEPRTLPEAITLANHMHASRLFSAYGTPQAVLATIMAGREFGLQAMAALRGFHIIEGKQVMSADLIRAVVQRAPMCEYFRCTERTATAATWVTKRRGDPELSLRFTLEEGRVAFSGDDAKFAKSGWGKNPADMCVARASAKLARLVYADIVFNTYAPEEIE